MDGKAMIVCMSRRICVDLYNADCEASPDWHNENDDAGSTEDRDDRLSYGWAGMAAAHQGQTAEGGSRQAIQRRERPFQVVIVRDMWLTGFDVPSLHTMYVDKPMRGHGLMQAIARVNRVFKDKPGGLVVDYLGIAHELKLALATYTESGGKGTTAFHRKRPSAVMMEKYEICRGLVPWVQLVGVDHRNLAARSSGFCQTRKSTS